VKIYVSGTFTAQPRLRNEAAKLLHKGHEITSTWLNEAAKPEQLSTREWERRLAEKDIAEVYAADLVILDLDEESTTGGRYVEWGVACAPGSMRLRYTVGANNRGCFNTMADRHFPNWEALHLFME
jgi:nucleoside 2-deoxyribosyltransferase